MRKKILLVLLTLLSSAVPSRAFLWWRDSVPCVRAEKPPTIDGSDANWNDFDEYESDGLSLRAMSDASNLYLLVEGRGKDGLAELSGRYRKDLTFWFVSTDKKKRVWGLRLPFSRDARGGCELPPGFPGEPPAGGAGVKPTFVEMRGHDDVDGPMPSDIAFAALLTERRSLYEIRVPLNRLPPNGKRTVLLDVDRDAPPADAYQRPVATSAGHNQSGGSDQSREGGMGGGMRGGTGGGGMGGGGMGGGGMGGGGMPRRGGAGGGPPNSPEIDAIDMRLKVTLAPGS
jgi:hypothetical protein